MLPQNGLISIKGEQIQTSIKVNIKLNQPKRLTWMMNSFHQNDNQPLVPQNEKNRKEVIFEI